MESSIKHGLLPLIDKAARLTGQHLAAARLADLQRQLDHLDEDGNPGAILSQVWQAAGLEGAARLLHDPTPGELPFAIYSDSTGWGLLQARASDGAWRGQGMDGRPLNLASLSGLACIGLPRRSVQSAGKLGALDLVRRALWLKKSVFVDAVLATAIVTILTMATSLFSMQVYDRVIPNQSFATLWVLVVGVALSIGLEFVLKQVRSRIVDHSCNEVDHELSEWFFQRMLGIRMEARPASVGTLAAQVKGFEMVRGVEATEALRKELVAHVRNEIGPIAAPDVIQWAPGLPKTRSGKIMRRILRKIAENELGALGDTSTLADPSVVDDLVKNRAG